MDNVGSNSSIGHGGGNSSRGNHPNHPPPPQQPQPEITANRYVFAADTPYPSQYPNPNPNPPPPPYYQYHPCGPVMHPPTPYVDHQKAVTIRNDVNLKKETLKIEADEESPGKFLVSFTFDASGTGSMTLYFFAKEDDDGSLTLTKEDLLPPITVSFGQGLGQKFRQPSGTGIDLSKFKEAELLKVGENEVYPLAVKAVAIPVSKDGNPGVANSQITQAVFEKDKDEYQVRVMKQILWVDGMRYELQEIYGIGNSVDGGDLDGNDPGKECVICLSEPRDTIVLPCRHMCICSGCAKVLRFQTNGCPICGQPAERLLEIKASNGAED